MVVETHKPMKCPDCGENVKRLQIDDSYGRQVCVVDPKPVASSNAGLTYQAHICDKEYENGIV